MSMRTARMAVVMVLATLLLSGCGATSDAAVMRLPVCDPGGFRTTVLMAQSVPTASRIPCLRRGLPSHWQLEDMTIDSAGSRLTFVSEMTSDTPDRLNVVLAARCDTSDAIAVTTDEVGTRRLEHIDVVASGYTGQRYYTFPGGCVTYRFTASGDDWTGFVEEAANLWTFAPRDQVMGRADAALGG